MNTTQNGLMIPFLGLIRGLLDNDGAREVLPMFDAFSEDVKRMAVPSPLMIKESERQGEDNTLLLCTNGVLSALNIRNNGQISWLMAVREIGKLRERAEILDHDLTMARAVIDRMPDKAEKPVNIPIEDDKESPEVVLPKGCSDAPKIEEKELGWPWTFHPDTARELVFEAIRKTPFKGIAYLWKELPDALSFLEANREDIEAITALSSDESPMATIKFHRLCMEDFEIGHPNFKEVALTL